MIQNKVYNCNKTNMNFCLTMPANIASILVFGAIYNRMRNTEKNRLDELFYFEWNLNKNMNDFLMTFKIFSVQFSELSIKRIHTFLFLQMVQTFVCRPCFFRGYI